jgi:hypothetical protein
MKMPKSMAWRDACWKDISTTTKVKRAKPEQLLIVFGKEIEL